MSKNRKSETLSIRKINDRFGAEISGIDVGSGFSDRVSDAIFKLVCKYGVIVLRGQSISDKQLLDFATSMGTPHRVPTLQTSDLHRLSNLNADGTILSKNDPHIRLNDANRLWHTDGSYVRPRPSIAFLYAVVVPPVGGDTCFCDMRCAWEDLPPNQRENLEGRVALHSLIFSKRETYNDWTPEQLSLLRPVERPLVEIHSDSGRKTLYVASHISHISGLEDQRAHDLVRDLIREATDYGPTYNHKWERGDLVLWDNRCMLHRATDFAIERHGRDLRTIRIEDQQDRRKLKYTDSGAE